MTENKDMKSWKNVGKLIGATVGAVWGMMSYSKAARETFDNSETAGSIGGIAGSFLGALAGNEDPGSTVKGAAKEIRRYSNQTRQK